MPLAVEAGSCAGAYAGPLLNPADLKRIASDLADMKRTRFEGPNVPRAKAVLVPLCHDLEGTPHALFTVEPDDFGADHASFPGAPIARTIRPRDAHSVSAAIREACESLGLGHEAFDRLQILGLTSDCPDVPKQTAVTPVVGYLGVLDVAAICSGANALKGRSPTRASPSTTRVMPGFSSENLISTVMARSRRRSASPGSATTRPTRPTWCSFPWQACCTQPLDDILLPASRPRSPG